MKAKMKACMAVLLAATGLASAEVLEEWKFDDAAGTGIRSCANSGSVGTLLGWQATSRYAADGNGNLDVLAGDGGYGVSDSFTNLADSAGTYSLEIKVAEWEIQSTNALAQLNYRLINATDTDKQIAIQTKLDPVSGFGFTFIAGGSNYRTHWIGGLTGSNAVARIDFNIDDGTAIYFLDGVKKDTISGLSITSIERILLQKEGFNTSPGTVLKVDEMSISFAADAPPAGTYVFDQYISNDSNATGTSTVKTFDAVVGDVIVVVSASSNKDEPGEASVVIGGTATTDPVVLGRADEYAGAATRYWYTTVTADGTVSVETIRNGAAYWNMGAYQLRAASGYSAPQLLGGVETGKLDGSSITNNYTLGTDYAGVYIEALSSYGDNWDPDNTNTVVNYGNQNKRNIGSGTFDGAATLDNVWTSVNTSQVTLIGLAFGSSMGLITPEMHYNDWLSGFAVGSQSNMTDDADGDLLDNLTEYMWGGEPDDINVKGNVPSLAQDGDFIEYIYYERSNSVARGLSSIFEFGTDLVITNWADATVYETGRSTGASDFIAVTNRIPTDVETKQFIKLDIKYTP